MTGIMGPSIALAGRALRLPSVVFYDTESARLTNSWVYRLASRVVLPDCYEGDIRSNFTLYAGYQELAYLHPSRFIPDESVLREFGLSPAEPLILLRYVSTAASHDIGQPFLNDSQKTTLVRTFENFGQVRISSEAPLPENLEPYRLNGPLWKVHHLLAFANLVVGESATMCSESAVLGTPAVYIAQTSRGYLNDLRERYGLVFTFTPAEFEPALTACVNVLGSTGRADEARKRLLAEKIDVTGWMVEMFEADSAI